MVEFGAGGTITQPEENVGATPGGDDVEANANGDAGAGNANVDTIQESPITIAARRRKRRAKGWFCPVCRQRQFLSSSNYVRFADLCFGLVAYTSLLRITTNPPPTNTLNTKPEAGSDPLTDDAPAESGTGGILSYRPGFLRQFSMGRNANANNAQQDVERGQQAPVPQQA